ncbi:MAG TPA: ECF-type sigma factor [Gemmatimonadaceae bacterium]|nr:ECF-type sigma factor [Gemmatimonadaceae bacterium]
MSEHDKMGNGATSTPLGTTTHLTPTSDASPSLESTRDGVLAALRSGQQESLDSLVALLYEELRLIAHRHLVRREHARDRRNSLATTALVNELYLKLVDQTQATWKDRAHFLAVAAVAMRHILIDHAKARVTQKRGAGHAPVTLEEEAIVASDSPEALLEIDEALDRLAQVDARLAKVVEYRFFGGFSEEETAKLLGVTTRTVQRDWAKARMLLQRLLAE